MKYLVKTYGKTSKAHLWNGVRTFCKLEKSKIDNNGYKITDTPDGLPICSVCNSLRKKNKNVVNVIRQGETIKSKIEYRNTLVASATQSEKIFKNILDRNKIRYEFQKIINGYVVDFFIAPDCIIEIDGSIHNKKDVAANDKIRQKHLESHGFKFIRFGNNEADNEQKILERLVL